MPRTIATCLLCFALLAFGGQAQGQAVPTREVLASSLSELSNRVRGLERQVGDEPEVRGPLVEVRLALTHADQALIRGDLAGAERAQRLALSGLALAERRYALQVERGLTRAATARRDQARAHADAATQARAAEERRVRELSAGPAGSAP